MTQELGQTKMNKKIFLFLMLLLILPIINSAQPTVTIPTSDLGIAIEHPIKDIIQANQTHKFHFHIFNVSDGKPFLNTTTNIKCVFHLYDLDGNHIQKINNVGSDDTYDWEALILGGNFTNIGQYSYVFQCNNSQIGGYYEHDFLVTPKGEILSVAQSILTFVLLFFSFAILSFFMFWGIKLPFKNTRDERGFYLVVNDKKWLKIICLVGSYIVLMWVMALLSSTANNFLSLESFGSFFYYFYYLMLSALFPLLIVTIIVMFALWVKDMKISKGIKQHLRMR